MINRATAEHYIWGQGCDGWHLVKRPEQGIISERMPPGTAEVRHYHRQARQFFYVLSGTATFVRDEQTVLLQSGQGIEVEPGMTHQICNKGREDLEFLVISWPHAHGDRVVLDGDRVVLD